MDYREPERGITGFVITILLTLLAIGFVLAMVELDHGKRPFEQGIYERRW